jgi:hypothetical protein
MLAEDDRYIVQVEVFTRPTGALLDGLNDSEALVGPAGELEVRLSAITVPSSSRILSEITPSKAVP